MMEKRRLAAAARKVMRRPPRGRRRARLRVAWVLTWLGLVVVVSWAAATWHVMRKGRVGQRDNASARYSVLVDEVKAGRVEKEAAVRPMFSAETGTRKNTTKKKRGSRKNHHRHHRKGARAEETAAPTSSVAEASCFPFRRPERPVVLSAKRRATKDTRGRRLRRFRVGPRKDLENFVAPTLQRLGLAQTKGMDWDVYVGLQFKPEYEKNYLLAPNGSIMSSIPGLKETIGDKEAFSRLWRACAKLAGSKPELEDALCGWTTPSYNFAHKRLPPSAERETTKNTTEFALAVEGGAEAFLGEARAYSSSSRSRYSHSSYSSPEISQPEKHSPGVVSSFDVEETRSSPEWASTWIVKPQRRYLSLGMHLASLTSTNASSLEALARWARVEVPPAEKKRKHHTKQPGEFTIQRYVERPALLGPRKFDLRLWLLIASVEPLVVYALDVAFPKISVVDYALPRDTTTLAAKCMHILMMVSEFCTKYVTLPLYPFPYPGITRPDLPKAKVPGRPFFQHLRVSLSGGGGRGFAADADSADGGGVYTHARDDAAAASSGRPSGYAPAPGLDASWSDWQTRLWPQLERTVLFPLLLAAPRVLEHEARIFGASWGGHEARRYHRFALLSPDAIWDVDAQRWRLEEINTNGLFQLGADEDSAAKTFHLDEGYTEGWMHLVGLDGFPDAPKYEAALRRKLDRFCAQRPACDARARDLLARVAHQNAHLSGGWYRLFPPVDCRPHCGPRIPTDLADDPAFQAFLKPQLSDLALMLHDFLTELDRAYFARAYQHTSQASPDPPDADSFPHYIFDDDDE